MLVLLYQNCQQKVQFENQPQQSEQSSSAPSQNQEPTPTEVQEFKTKSFWFYGTRVNGKLALVAELSDVASLPVKLSLQKHCGSIDDMQIAGNGQNGQFIFVIPAGSKKSEPVILSQFPTGEIVWKVNIVSQMTGAAITDIAQTCSPWLRSGAASLCQAPNNQPYCIDRGSGG